MSGEFGGLQKLVKEGLSSAAIYIHCFCHRLNLVIVALARDNDMIEKFFETIQDIYVITSASSKRMDLLRKELKIDIEKLIEEGEVETGSGLNQQRTLGSLCKTRWNYREQNLVTVKQTFGPLSQLVREVVVRGDNAEQRNKAQSCFQRMSSYEFALCLHIMTHTLGITKNLSVILQSKTMDFVTAVALINSTRKLLVQFATDEGWDTKSSETVEFCNKYEIYIPKLTSLWEPPVGVRKKKADEDLSVSEYYRKYAHTSLLKNLLHDFNERFNNDVIFVLSGASALDPSNNFESFDIKNLLELAKYYSADFTAKELNELEGELRHFRTFVQDNPRYKDATTFAKLAESVCKDKTFLSQTYKLVCLINVLPITSATAERTFSALKIIKTRLRNKIGDDWLVHCLIIFIEKEIAKGLTTQEIVNRFKNDMGISCRST